MARPPKYTPEELEKAVDEYFETKEKKRKEENKKTMYTSIYDISAFLNIHSDTWRNYKSKSSYSDIIKRAEERIYANWVEQLYYPGRNSTGAMFYLKNNAGWADRVEHQHNVSGHIEHDHAQRLESIDPDKLQRLSDALKQLKPADAIDVEAEEAEE